MLCCFVSFSMLAQHHTRCIQDSGIPPRPLLPCSLTHAYNFINAPQAHRADTGQLPAQARAVSDSQGGPAVAVHPPTAVEPAWEGLQPAGAVAYRDLRKRGTLGAPFP